MVELEGASLVFLGRLDLEELAADLQVRCRDTGTDAVRGYSMALHVALDEVLADVSPVGVGYSAERLKRGVGPDRFGRVLPDDEEHQLDRIHSGAVHKAPGRSRFQNTRK